MEAVAVRDILGGVGRGLIEQQRKRENNGDIIPSNQTFPYPDMFDLFPREIILHLYEHLSKGEKKPFPLSVMCVFW